MLQRTYVSRYRMAGSIVASSSFRVRPWAVTVGKEDAGFLALNCHENSAATFKKKYSDFFFLQY